MKRKELFIRMFTLSVLISVSISAYSQQSQVDEKVKKFLASKGGQWYDMNVPSTDGQLLYDLIIKNNSKSVLEIGTSTGHSGIWIAWALSKTGGRLITIDIDEDRHKEALRNFKEAGVDHLIDARLADAHQLVKELKGPFDFVFSDADKEWYKNYFIDIDPKLIVGGCFTAHNVYDRGGRGSYGGQAEFLQYVKSLPNYETTVNNSGGGLSISYKRSVK